MCLEQFEGWYNIHKIANVSNNEFKFKYKFMCFIVTILNKKVVKLPSPGEIELHQFGLFSG